MLFLEHAIPLTRFVVSPVTDLRKRKMQTRLLKMTWVALCAGVFLMAGSVAPTQAIDWSKCKCKCKKTDDCQDDEAAADDCPEDGDGSSGKDCRPSKGELRKAARRNKCQYCCSCYIPVDRFYCDPRDLRVYSAQGYGVPVTVPLAPVCRQYNYGWGIPSSRLSQAGSYAAWHPDQPYSQSGGRLPGGVYPTVYHATDTTQLGYYHNYVPTWQPRRW
jgi:hypothetical protein